MNRSLASPVPSIPLLNTVGEFCFPYYESKPICIQILLNSKKNWR